MVGKPEQTHCGEGAEVCQELWPICTQGSHKAATEFLLYILGIRNIVLTDVQDEECGHDGVDTVTERFHPFSAEGRMQVNTEGLCIVSWRLPVAHKLVFAPGGSLADVREEDDSHHQQV